MKGPVTFVLFGIAGVPAAVWAQASDPGSAATVEEQTAFRDRLSSCLLLVTVLPDPDPLVDASFLPRKHGMAVRVTREDRFEVLTSAAMVANARLIEVSAATEPDRTVRVSPHPLPGGLAEVRCPRIGEGGDTRSPCDHGPAAATAPAGACDPGQFLHAVVPAGAGRFVLVSTVVAARGGVLPEDMALVQGRFPEGTPLFDAEGRVAAVVVRLAADSSARSLAAPLSPPGDSSDDSPRSPPGPDGGSP